VPPSYSSCLFREPASLTGRYGPSGSASSAARRNETADYRLEMIIDGGADTTPQGTGTAGAGVKRQGQGAAIVTITRPDGRSRTIFFETGRVTGYDQGEADSGKLSVSRQGDLNIIQIGPECYEIPDALPFGG
jgi:hypothetical protein